MSSESDDEPLSILAAAKKADPNKFVNDCEFEIQLDDNGPKKSKNTIPHKNLSVTIKLARKLKTGAGLTVIERPTDVWLYLKDLNPTGPYSCLLCSDWFINRSKLIVHYILNHKKDFCGICRYFVPDRELWWSHIQFHTPWPCSQCVDTFPSETLLRQHLNTRHQLVHCRLCHFRVPADDQYDTHLLHKHNVTNAASKDEEFLWVFEYEGSDQFHCLLCSKSDNPVKSFFNHYMCFHHFTLKCLTSLISGRDLPFIVNGADVSSQFVNDQLMGHTRFGYVDLEMKPIFKLDGENKDLNQMQNVDVQIIKKENVSDNEESKCDDNNSSESRNDENQDYNGEDDYDTTQTELVIFQKCYLDYVSELLSDISANSVPENSDINYENLKCDVAIDVVCKFCNEKYDNAQSFISHMNKMHGIKSVPIYSCRVCTATFETLGELEIHSAEELADFEDLWLCQFCDKEFDNRQETRKHLNEHVALLDHDNCFSPHLGFKCKYCPNLFWNETDRESHQVKEHLNKYIDQFYKCKECSEAFSDKVWYTHHHFVKHANEEHPYMLKCCLCCVVLVGVDEMREHFKEKHPEAKKVFCSLDGCNHKPLSHRKSLKLHVKSMHCTAGQEKPVKCKLCGKGFTSSRACRNHAAQVHGPGKYKCKLCREVLHTMDERKLHYLLRHPGRHPFECSECGKSFQYKSSLYMHKQEHVPNKKCYTCDYCGKSFLKKDSFREHVQIHEGPRHACSYCPMRFVQRSNMLRHERRHTGERPYACAHCPRTFADKGACTSHTRTHSKDTSYACLYCGQTFVQKSKLTYHIRKHTGENLETCTVCSKLFTSGCALREHMKIHVAKKKQTVKCPLCDRKYQDERYMLRHLRTSHTSAQFSCPVPACPRLLVTPAALRHHVLTHSPVSTFRCKCCPKSYACKKSMVKHLRRRHGLNGAQVNIKEFFDRLDPWECQIELDEATMTSVFGPPKKKVNDILLGDFVTLANKIKLVQENIQKQMNAAEEAKQRQENQIQESEYVNVDGGRAVVKEECKSSEDELEPTDFVSVKVEPMDDYEAQS